MPEFVGINAQAMLAGVELTHRHPKYTVFDRVTNEKIFETDNYAEALTAFGSPLEH